MFGVHLLLIVEFYNAVDGNFTYEQEDKNDIIKLLVTESNLEFLHKLKICVYCWRITSRIKLEDDSFEISVSGKYLKMLFQLLLLRKIVVKFSGS